MQPERDVDWVQGWIYEAIKHQSTADAYACVHRPLSNDIIGINKYC